MQVEPFEVRQDLLHLLDGWLHATCQGEPLPQPLLDLGGVHPEQDVRLGFSNVLDVLSQTDVVLTVRGPTLGESPVTERALIYILSLQELVCHFNTVTWGSGDLPCHLELEALSCVDARLANVHGKTICVYIYVYI